MTKMSCNKINPHVLRYMEEVESGKIRACNEQHLLIKHIRKCFETEDIYIDDEQLEHYLHQAVYFPFEKLFPWEEFITGLHLCTYWKSNKMPRWPDLFCLIGRGAGKDGYIAFESDCLTSPYNGIHAYDVDICANDEEQAMRPVKDVVDAFENPKYIKKLKRYYYWTKENVICLKTKSHITGHTSNFKTKDGLRSGAVILNEIHQYENYKLIAVFTTGLGKKKHPRRDYFTTDGNVRDGPLDDLKEKSELILTGERPDNGLLPFICKLNKKSDVDDPKNWEMANPSLPYRPDLMMEIQKEYRDWKERPYQLSDFMTKRMNLPQSAEAAPVTEWDNISATNRPLPDMTGWQCTVGIDYASLRDWASVDFHFKRDNLRYDISHSWICLQSPELNRIRAPWNEWSEVTPVDEVEISPDLLTEYIAETGKKYYIRKLACDNFRFALLKNSLLKIGFDAKNQKNIYLLRPSDVMRVQPVIDSCFINHLYTWGDTPSLRWATNNAKLVRSGRKDGTDTGNFYYAKIEAKSRKTDPFMAHVASMAVEDEIQPPLPKNAPTLGVIIG